MCCVMPPASPAATLALRMRVEQGRLAVVDVAHDGDDRRTRHGVLSVARRTLCAEQVLLLERDVLHLEAELRRDERAVSKSMVWLTVDHHAHREQLLDDLAALDGHLVRELADRDEAVHLDDALVRRRLRDLGALALLAGLLLLAGVQPKVAAAACPGARSPSRRPLAASPWPRFARARAPGAPASRPSTRRPSWARRRSGRSSRGSRGWVRAPARPHRPGFRTSNVRFSAASRALMASASMTRTTLVGPRLRRAAVAGRATEPGRPPVAVATLAGAGWPRRPVRFRATARPSPLRRCRPPLRRRGAAPDGSRRRVVGVVRRGRLRGRVPRGLRDAAPSRRARVQRRRRGRRRGSARRRLPRGSHRRCRRGACDGDEVANGVGRCCTGSGSGTTTTGGGASVGGGAPAHHVRERAPPADDGLLPAFIAFMASASSTVDDVLHDMTDLLSFSTSS